MTIKKFEFKKAYEEMEIAGEVYKIDMSDEKVSEYQKAFKRFYEDSKGFENIDISAISDLEQAAMLEKQRENMKGFTELVLGIGTYDKLYELSGRSSANYMELLMFIAEIFVEKTNGLKEDARLKYVKNK